MQFGERRGVKQNNKKKDGGVGANRNSASLLFSNVIYKLFTVKKKQKKNFLLQKIY